jgi:hypothetical protein
MKLLKLLAEIKGITKEEFEQLKDIKTRIREWYQYCETDLPEYKAWLEEELQKIQYLGQFNEKVFKNIWEKYLEYESSGDVGADWDAYKNTYNWIITGRDEEEDGI